MQAARPPDSGNRKIKVLDVHKSQDKAERATVTQRPYSVGMSECPFVVRRSLAELYINTHMLRISDTLLYATAFTPPPR